MTPLEVRSLLDQQLRFADPNGFFGYDTPEALAWADFHPSGFEGRQPQNTTITIEPVLIAQSIVGFPDTAAEEYVLSVADWLLASTYLADFGSTEAVIRFIDKFPNEASLLSSVATVNGCSLMEWLYGRKTL